MGRVKDGEYLCSYADDFHQEYTLADSNVSQKGGERYQQAFYVFEEMAQAPGASGTKPLVCQAVAELHLGRLPEAEAALEQAIQRDPEDVEAIANFIVLSVISGKGPGEKEAELKSKAPSHPLLLDLQEKSSLFDNAAAKYSAKVAS